MTEKEKETTTKTRGVFICRYMNCYGTSATLVSTFLEGKRKCYRVYDVYCSKCGEFQYRIKELAE